MPRRLTFWVNHILLRGEMPLSKWSAQYVVSLTLVKGAPCKLGPLKCRLWGVTAQSNFSKNMLQTNYTPVCRLFSGGPIILFRLSLHFRSYPWNKPTSWLASEFKIHGITGKGQLCTFCSFHSQHQQCNDEMYPQASKSLIYRIRKKNTCEIKIKNIWKNDSF